MGYTNKVKRKSSLRTTVNHFLRSEPFKQYDIISLDNEEETYINNIILWHKDNNLTRLNGKLYKFVADQIRYYHQEERKYFWDNFLFYMTHRWASADINCWIGRLGKIEGTKRFNEIRVTYNNRINKSELQLEEMDKKVSLRFKKLAKERGSLWRKEKSHMCPEYWMKHKGMTHEEAQKKIADFHSWLFENRKPAVHKPETINTRLEFYLAKGMSIEEAENALRIRQTTRNLPPEEKIRYVQYRRRVDYYTRKHIPLLESVYKVKRSSQNHIDHIYSIYDGFKNNIDPRELGKIENLRFLPYNENIKKGKRSDMTMEQLYELGK